MKHAEAMQDVILSDDDIGIRRADGVMPVNQYLWPTESWWANREPDMYTVCGMFNIAIVELADGRFSTDGTTWSIRDGHDMSGRQVLFSYRSAAIRVSAARMILLARASRKWGINGLSPSRCMQVINWARAVVARETGKPIPQHRRLVKKVERTGLELFDFGNENKVEVVG